MALKTAYYNCPKCKSISSLKFWESVDAEVRIWEWECYRCHYRKWKWIFMEYGQGHANAYES